MLQKKDLERNEGADMLPERAVEVNKEGGRPSVKDADENPKKEGMSLTDEGTAGKESGKTGKIDTVRKVLAVIGCVLMLGSFLFPFLRMTEPNGMVTDLTRSETFEIGMPGWDAGPSILWTLIAMSCILILVFHFRNQRKTTRHGCRIALLVVLFDVLTIAGFIAQYGPDEITFFPLAGFWLLAAGCLITWIASFLHKRKRRTKKHRKGRRDRNQDLSLTGPGEAEEFDDAENQMGFTYPEDPEDESESGSVERENASGKSGKKLYREMKKQQKLEREERMRRAAEKRDEH